MPEHHQSYSKSIRIAFLIAGLVSLLLVATGVIVAMIQVQAAVSGYLSGLSVWTQSQVSSAYHLARYADTGHARELVSARKYLKIPLADRQARLAMESGESLDIAASYLIAGDNHPDDASRMILLFDYFGNLGKLQKAFEVWKRADVGLLKTESIANELEQLWSAPQTDIKAIQQLQIELSAINVDLEQQSTQFRQVMTGTARWLTHVLTLGSIAFILLMAGIAFWLVRRLNHLLEGSQFKYQAIFEQAAVGIAHLSDNEIIKDINPAICDILSTQPERLKGRKIRDLIHSDDWSLDEVSRQELNRGRIDRYTIEQRLAKRNNFIWARLTYSRSQQPSQANHLTLIIEDISESRRLSNELSFQATHDILTGLFNRRAFERRLAESLTRARNERVTHALCFIDLDQFKVVNDTSGHSAGDRLLQQVTDLFTHNLREGDMLARLGGDEFAMILENCSIDDAGKIAEKLRIALEDFHFSCQKHSYDISCSIGVVPISEEDLDTESIMRSADIACYLAKEKGRNFVYLAREDDSHRQERAGELQWISRIRDAIDENRLFLDAQKIEPLQRAESNISYEVLVRLRDENGEIVPPSAFLPAAERFGAAQQIDRWVVNHTLLTLSQYPDHLSKLDKCHINISGLSLDKKNFYQFVIDAFDKYQVDPHKICFEVTETAAVNNLLDAVQFMESLGETGCSFALDDFGTGLSSFSYLKRLPVDTLKIDGTFVRDITSDKTDLAMVKAINEIGQTLSKTTIAEFVEDEPSKQLLIEIGVNYGQGYGIHKPQHLVSFIRDNS
ncbi:EAL domain-containing protein [Gilvimarinus sp. SDUM040013]|uniref:EAL domain-containing protein n=1 Tax=Gilvimarinus gilvus TaxID=3058038 RepID=A0ABU4S1B9_9GAMM|nr:EAL domain-containing protein [Gilvimarinus sp. SDUM040013]MDO3384610.1 EAL domain-containing protein [Gilvimarinus sp. SDUM040013]MDX6850196.1 EAL domain-containing protein [Gilvimarinus sp. SDUM040013]